MIRSRVRLLLLAFLATSFVAALAATLAAWPALGAEDEKAPPASNRRPLFNGKNLDGWRVIDQHDFERHGEVTVADGQIVLGKGKPATGVALAKFPGPAAYEIRLEAKRLEGDDFFCGLTFPVGEEHASLIIGGWGGGVTGLSNINGMSAVENETTGYQEFQPDRWYAIRLRVSEQKIEAWVDDEQIVDVERKGKRFAVWWEQEPARPLGIVTWNTKAAVRSITLESLAP